MQTFYPQQVYELLQDLHNHVPGATAEYMDADELIQAIMLNDGLVEWVPHGDGQMLEVTTKGLAELGRHHLKEPSEARDRTGDTLDERALAQFFADPTLTKTQIAKKLGVTHAQSLCPARCPKLDAAVRAHKARRDPTKPVRRGYKDKDGNLDAWEEDE